MLKNKIPIQGNSKKCIMNKVPSLEKSSPHLPPSPLLKWKNNVDLLGTIWKHTKILNPKTLFY
jgi:hypothetical protein